MLPKYLYAFTHDGFGSSTIRVYRQDKYGTILYANINDKYYRYADLAEVPRRVIEIFRTNSHRYWDEKTVIEQETPFWGLKETDSETGITFEEFMNIVLSRIQNSSYENGIFYVIVYTATGTKKMKIPNSTLKQLARSNKYFGNAYWMA